MRTSINRGFLQVATRRRHISPHFERLVTSLCPVVHGGKEKITAKIALIMYCTTGRNQPAITDAHSTNPDKRCSSDLLVRISYTVDPNSLTRRHIDFCLLVERDKHTLSQRVVPHCTVLLSSSLWHSNTSPELWKNICWSCNIPE